MADLTRAPRGKRMQLSIEETELRALSIPSSLHRGALSPSKNSFLPTLKEQASDRAQRLPEKAQRLRSGRLRPGSRGEDDETDEVARQRLQQLHASHLPPEQQVLSGISAEVLDSVKEDFVEHGGSLHLEQFARAMLRHLDTAEDKKEKTPSRSGKGVAFVEQPEFEPEQGKEDEKEPDLEASLTASVVDLFRRVDIHGEGAITWDEVSNYIIEQAMAGQDEFAVDSIKSYETSPCIDQSKHENAVEKLVYLDQIDSVVCLSHNSRRFRLYDPKRCTVRNEVAGHRGTVINCCFVDAFHQIATTGADMTICLWDTAHLGLRNRLSTKEVQLCLQWDNHSKSLFSGSIDGTLSRWDLNGMWLTDAQKGKHKKAINDLLTVSDINLLASASSDGSILMWDTTLMRPKKTFKGHKKGTFSLAYSMDYHCLLTAGLDQEALVWNPYVERVPIFRLKGHTHALCGVAVVPGTPQVLTADVTGSFRLWDMRNFRCVQNFGGSETQVNELNTFCAIPRYKRVAAGSSKITLYDYPDEGSGESITDTAGVTEALYNPNAGEFYTVTKQSVKAWNAATGTVFKILRDITPSEITAACLADNGRKLYLGDAKGRVAAHALHNGNLLTEFEKHNTDISCLAVWKGTNRLFSSSWDGVVKIHSDEGPRIPQTKAEFQCHRDGVACLACSPELMLLASGGTGTDSQVILYDLKTLKIEHVLARFKNVIAGLDFLHSRCLLAVADQGGLVSLWRTRPQAEPWVCVCYFKNLADPLSGEPATPLSALRFFGTASTAAPNLAQDGTLAVASPGGGAVAQGPLLYTADAKGAVRCWSLAAMCERHGIVEEDLAELFEQMRSAQLGKRVGIGTEKTTTRPLIGGLLALPTTPSPVPGGAPLPLSDPAVAGAPLLALTPAGEQARTSDVAPSQGAFLTGIGDEGDGEDGQSTVTTVRAAHVQDRRCLPAAVSSTDTGTQQEVKLLFEKVEGHTDAVASLHFVGEPLALVTCGLDKRVRTWSASLEHLGVLLQRRDRNFQFPYDLAAARRVRIAEAEDLLRRLGPLTRAQPRLPALPPTGARNAPDTLELDFGAGRKKKSTRREKTGALWKQNAEQVLEDPDACDEDYRILFEQMERLGMGGNNLDDPAGFAPERLLRHAHARQAEQMPLRNTALSHGEAAAAERLANAMSALGGDDFGTYTAMARSIRPRQHSSIGGGGYPYH